MTDKPTGEEEMAMLADEISIANLAARLASETEENAKLRARVEELEGVIAAVVKDVSERTKAGMSWGLHGHPTMSPKSLFLLTSRSRSTLGDTDDK